MSVDHRRFLAVQRQLVGLVGDGETGVVGDVLAQRELAVDVIAGHRLDTPRIGAPAPCVLALNLSRSAWVNQPGALEQIAVAIVLTALIVEAMTDLVADDGADAAVVDRIVGRRIEERRLQDGGGKHDLVHLGVVVGVDRLRRHAPLAAIDRLAQLIEIAVVFECLRADHIADQIVACRSAARCSRATCPDSRSSVVKFASFSCAFCLVSALIQSSLSISALVGGQQVLHQLHPCAPWIRAENICAT